MTEAKSKTMLVAKGATVIRDGKRVRPQIGKNFEFSAQEVEDLNAATPGTLVKASETEAGKAAKATTTTKGSNAETSQAGAKGGSKKATASKADGEESADTGKGDDDL